MRKLLLILLAVLLSRWAARFAIDFNVYREAAAAAFLEGRVPYGEAEGLEWPMWYRYPPFFLIPAGLFLLMPYVAGAFVWALGKCAVAVTLIRSLIIRLGGAWEVERWFPAAAVAAPYWVLELRYGNVQFYTFALTALGLLWARERPRVAGGALGVAIAAKVWPLFFLPLLGLKGARQAVAAALVVALVLTFVPALFFGWSTNLDWLQQWYAQESAISADAGAVWFPSQSFYGVARRHLSVIDYSTMPDPNYRTIHWAELSPQTVRLIWMAVATVCCLALFAGAWRSGESKDLEWMALAFCVLALFQPFAQKHIALTVLLWPALVAAARARGWAKFALSAAAFMAVYQLLLPASMQRLLLVVGIDAAVILLLGLSLLPSTLRREA